VAAVHISSRQAAPRARRCDVLELCMYLCNRAFVASCPSRSPTNQYVMLLPAIGKSSLLGAICSQPIHLNLYLYIIGDNGGFERKPCASSSGHSPGEACPRSCGSRCQCPSRSFCGCIKRSWDCQSTRAGEHLVVWLIGMAAKRRLAHALFTGRWHALLGSLVQ